MLSSMWQQFLWFQINFCDFKSIMLLCYYNYAIIILSIVNITTTKDKNSYVKLRPIYVAFRTNLIKSASG